MWIILCCKQTSVLCYKMLVFCRFSPNCKGHLIHTVTGISKLVNKSLDTLRQTCYMSQVTRLLHHRHHHLLHMELHIHPQWYIHALRLLFSTVTVMWGIDFSALLKSTSWSLFNSLHKVTGLDFTPPPLSKEISFSM